MVAIEEQSFETTDYPIDSRLFGVLMANEHATILTAVHQGLVVGYVCLVKGKRIAHIYSIAVLKAYRGRGIGTKLLEEAERNALNSGIIAIRLQVRTGNKAIALYQRSGYSVKDRRNYYYGTGKDAICMEKQLHHRGGYIEKINIAG